MEVEAAVLTRRAACVAAFVIALTSGGLFAASPRWTIVRSGSLTVVGETSPEAVRDVARRLEQFRTALASISTDTRRPLPLPTIVYVFASRASMQPFLPLRDGRPAALRGYFHRDLDEYAIAIAADETDESASIVFHEYAHLLVQRGRTLPIWLNEGLAEYFSTFAIVGAGRTADIGRPIAKHVRLLRQRFLPLSELLAVSASSELYDESDRRSLFYAEAWALTHYLIEEVPDGPALINRYGAAAGEGRATEQVFRDVFGVTPAQFEPRLREYVARGAFRSRAYTFAARIDVDERDSSRRLSEADADAWLGDLQRRIGRLTEAAVRLERSAAKDPETAAAALAIARLRLDQNRLADARAALSKAIELEPSSAAAFGWMAYAQMMAGNIVEARAAIARALALDPERPEFLLRDADVAVLEGDVARARSILRDLLAITSDPSVAARAQERLNVIEPRR